MSLPCDCGAVLEPAAGWDVWRCATCARYYARVHAIEAARAALLAKGVDPDGKSEPGKSEPKGGGPR